MNKYLDAIHSIIIRRHPHHDYYGHAELATASGIVSVIACLQVWNRRGWIGLKGTPEPSRTLSAVGTPPTSKLGGQGRDRQGRCHLGDPSSTRLES